MFFMFAVLPALGREQQRRFASDALHALAAHGREVFVYDQRPPSALELAFRCEPYRDGHDLPPLPDNWEEQAAVAVAVLANSLVGQTPVKKVEPKARPPPGSRA